jgi:hypothetical protein
MHKNISLAILRATTVFAALALTQSPSIGQSVTPSEARTIAKEAYIYGVPMVSVYATMYVFGIDKTNKEYKGPFNSVLNVARVFTPEDTAFVTPNSDTPYTFIILDLRAEPMVVTVPPMEKNTLSFR